MTSLLLLSIIIATVGFPIAWADDAKPQRAHKRVITAMAVSVFVWGMILHYFYFRSRVQ